MEVDFKILKQDVKFPLSWDTIEYKMYIFDANLEMVAQVDLYNTSEWKENHPFAKLLGKMKTGERTVESHQYFLDSGDFYDREKVLELAVLEDGEDYNTNLLLKKDKITLHSIYYSV